MGNSLIILIFLYLCRFNEDVYETLKLKLMGSQLIIPSWLIDWLESINTKVATIRLGWMSLLSSLPNQLYIMILLTQAPKVATNHPKWATSNGFFGSWGIPHFSLFLLISANSTLIYLKFKLKILGSHVVHSRWPTLGYGKFLNFYDIPIYLQIQL